MRSILTVIGTRPEAIKLAPVLSAIHENKRFVSKVCLTRQHTDLLDPFISDLKSAIQYQLKNDRHEKDLQQSAARILEQFTSILIESKAELVIVQGDTTSAFACALAAFYAHIPIAHIEAGLRTGSMTSPWPEEAHRCLIDRLATYFFAPTEQAKERLLLEGVAPEKVWVVGNTSIDAIRIALDQSLPSSPASPGNHIVVTVHRRENQGERLTEICCALRYLAQQFPKIRILFFLHPNPQVRLPVMKMLFNVGNIVLLDPLDHVSFIKLLSESLFIITDSGGIQEEVSILGKPVLVVRDTTERPESIIAGTSQLAGTKASTIIRCCKELLENEEKRIAMSKVHFSYGDGYAAKKIVNILDQVLG